MREFSSQAEFILKCKCGKNWAYSHAEFLDANRRLFLCSCGNALPLLEEYMSIPTIIKVDSYIPLLESDAIA